MRGNQANGRTVRDLLAEATRELRLGGVDEPRREAQLLISAATGRDRTNLITRADDPLSDAEVSRARAFVRRRAAGEPPQYITGRQEFYGLEFEVTPDVLIPRPETELIVEAGLELLDATAGKLAAPPLFCDVGTGSGCVTIALLANDDRARGVALDISEAALRVARRNAERHAVASRARFVASDVFGGLRSSSADRARFALVVSNPPYIDADEVQTLQREVRDYEPRRALTPGADGLAVIRRLLRDAPAHLAEGGHLVFEIGYGQAASVRALVDQNVWRVVDVRPDLQNIPRVFVLRARASVTAAP